MARAAITALVLAALSVTSANASPATPGTADTPAHPPATKHQQLHHADPHPARHVARHPASHPPIDKHPKVEHPHVPVNKPNKHPKRPPAHPVSIVRYRHQPSVSQTPALRAALSSVPPLRGSHDSLVRQNEKTEAEGLERIEDDDDLADRIARKMLVPVPVSSALAINESLPLNRRYCRPWTADFLSDLAKAHAALFHHALFVSSAVRTVEYQKELQKVNGNAAAAEGDIVSPHVTGSTIDIAKQDLTRLELAWMRTWLLRQEIAGAIDVEEEFLQSCFHITVYQSYVPPSPPAPAPRSKRHRGLNLTTAIASRGR
jgi:hypothetical protein